MIRIHPVKPGDKTQAPTREIQKRTLQTILLTHPFDAGISRAGWQLRPAMLTLQAQGWDFTPSSPPCQPLRGTFCVIIVAKIFLKPVRVLRGLLLEEGILLQLCVLIVVLVVMSLVCRKG